MKSIDIITLREPKSPIAEAYRALRTNIRFASFEKDIKAIAVTSTYMNEGKSTIVSNLGVSMAESGSKVLIIDGDLRNPTIHKFFLLSNNVGLTNILVEKLSYRDFLSYTEISNLDIITCGPKPPNPSELLGSSKMKSLLQELKEDYDYILIDTPPVAIVTDAAIMASVCDGTLLVISSGETIIEEAVKSRELLQNINANVLGVVFNKAKVDKPKDYYKYNNYYYGNLNNKNTGKRNRIKRG